MDDPKHYPAVYVLSPADIVAMEKVAQLEAEICRLLDWRSRAVIMLRTHGCGGEGCQYCALILETEP